MFESRLGERSTIPDFFLNKTYITTGSRLSGRVLFKGAHVCMYDWIHFCNRIIENKRNETKKDFKRFSRS